MDDFTEIVEDTPNSEGDSIHLLPQLSPQEGNVEASAPIRKSSRRWKASARALEIRDQESLNLNKAYSAVPEEKNNQQYYKAMHQDNYNIQDDMEDPLAYLAIYDPDTMYFDQAMKEPDRQEFLNAAIREVNSHRDLKHWKLLPLKDASKGQPILDYVWAMKEKHDIVKGQVYKWKARLNVHGVKREYGVNYM